MGLNGPRFFISHKETDQTIAECIVNVILESFEVLPENIFCTSVPGHALQFGVSIESQIKSGLQDGDVLFVLLTQDSVRSTWVLFELGAAWGLNRLIIPILGPGVTYKGLPGALADYPCISIDEPDAKVRGRVEDALKQVSERLSLQRKSGGRSVNALEKLLTTLRQSEPILNKALVLQQLFPAEYEIHQSDYGGTILRSSSQPYHYLCPTCYSKEKQKILLQGNYDRSIFLECTSCKARYQIRSQPPQNFTLGNRR